MNETEIPSDEILGQMERVLAHRLFQKAQLLSGFFRYVVVQTLSGGADRLKELVIGYDVFKRGGSFDPQIDNVVRVNANRLRSKLAEYYLLEGRLDPIIIELPRGGYVPSFRRVSAAPSAALSPPFPPNMSVGRNLELRDIEIAFVRAANGKGSMIAVSGDAGVGKTTLVENFLYPLDKGADVWVARGRCAERLSKTDAFAPIFECLDRLAGSEEPISLLKRYAPTWLGSIAAGADSSTHLSGGGSQERMRREFLHFLEALCETRPVIVLLEDVHWLDLSTCDLLSFLCTRIRQMRLLLMVTFRNAELIFSAHPFLTLRLAVERGGDCKELPLQPLTQSDVDEYLRRRFPLSSFPEDFAHLIHKRTEGNPLFMVDLVNFLHDKQALLEQTGQGQLTWYLAELETQVPASTQSMIRLQIEHFAEGDYRILQCAAVQGVHFDSAVVAKVLSLDAATVEDRLQILERLHRFVRHEAEQVFPDGTFTVRYRFHHVLYQNTLYADVTPTRKAALSLAIAETLVRFSAHFIRSHAAAVATLFEAGRDNDKAAEYFLCAAKHTAKIFAFPETVLLCQRGLKTLALVPESVERDRQELALTIALGMAQMSTCGFAAPEIETTHKRARDLCIRLNDSRHLVRMLWRLHTVQVNAGNLVSALELAREMRSVAEQLNTQNALVESLHAYGTTLAFMGRLTEAHEILQRIFLVAPISSHRFDTSLYVLDPCVTSLSLLARLRALMGFLDSALDLALKSLALAEELAHPHSIAYATFWVGWIYNARSDHAEACLRLQAAMELGNTHGLPQVIEWARMLLGSSLTQVGRVAEGITELRQGLNNQTAMHCLIERPFCLTLLAESLVRADRPMDALPLCEEALAIAHRTEARSFEAETHRVWGEALLASRDLRRVGEARAEFAKAIDIAAKADCKALELRAAISEFRCELQQTGALVNPLRLKQVVDWFSNESNNPWVAEGERLLSQTRIRGNDKSNNRLRKRSATNS